MFYIFLKMLLSLGFSIFANMLFCSMRNIIKVILYIE